MTAFGSSNGMSLHSDFEQEPRVPSIDSTYNIISSYDSDLQELLIQFHLEQESIVSIELFYNGGSMLSTWNPEIAHAGTYRSILSLDHIPDGTYLLMVHINDSSFRQAVFKY